MRLNTLIIYIEVLKKQLNKTKIIAPPIGKDATPGILAK